MCFECADQIIKVLAVNLGWFSDEKLVRVRSGIPNHGNKETSLKDAPCSFRIEIGTARYQLNKVLPRLGFSQFGLT